MSLSGVQPLQVPLALQVLPPEQATQAPPPLPHTVPDCCAYGMHVVPEQQPPAQFVAVQLGVTGVHAPLVQVEPEPHATSADA